MNSDVSSTALPVLGYPIWKSSDQSLFDSSPRLIAAHHVLHRFLVPRYPSYSLNNLIAERNNLSPCSYQRAKNFNNSGDEQIRTADLRLAKAALSQLSYIPRWAFLELNQGPYPYQGYALTD